MKWHGSQARTTMLHQSYLLVGIIAVLTKIWVTPHVWHFEYLLACLIIGQCIDYWHNTM